jgi:hypothetical protein
VAFVDDDDTLSKFYVDALLEEAVATPDVNVVLFRMRNPVGAFIPAPHIMELVRNQVGISFAFKRYLYSEGFRFVNAQAEDLDMMRLLAASTSVRSDVPRVVVMSPLCMYFVRTAPVMDTVNATLADMLVPNAQRALVLPTR